MDKSSLLKALDIVRPAVSTKIFQPALRCFMFSEGMVRGYNGELYIATKFDSDLNCCIPAEIFYKLISSVSNTFGVKIEDQNIIVKSGGIRAKIPTLPISDFPTPSEPSPTQDTLTLPLSYVHPEGELYTAINKSLQFIGHDETQPAYRGVFVGEEYVYASDGFRIARHKIQNHVHVKAFLPESFCNEILKHKPLTLELTDTGIFFIEKNTYVHTSGASDQFPDCESIFASLAPPDFLIPTNISLDRLELFTSGQIDKFVTLNTEGNTIKFSVTNPLAGEIVETLQSPLPLPTLQLTVDLPLLKTVLVNTDRFGVVQGGDFNKIKGETDSLEALLVTI